MLALRELVQQRNAFSGSPASLAHNGEQIGRVHWPSKRVNLGIAIEGKKSNMGLVYGLVSGEGEDAELNARSVSQGLFNLMRCVTAPVLIDDYSHHNDRLHLRRQLLDLPGQESHPYLTFYKRGLLRTSILAGIPGWITTIAKRIKDAQKSGQLMDLAHEINALVGTRRYQVLPDSYFVETLQDGTQVTLPPVRQVFEFTKVYDTLSVAKKLKLAEWVRERAIKALSILSDGVLSLHATYITDIDAIIRHEGLLEMLPDTLQETPTYEGLNKMIEDGFAPFVKAEQERLISLIAQE